MRCSSWLCTVSMVSLCPVCCGVNDYRPSMGAVATAKSCARSAQNYLECVGFAHLCYMWTTNDAEHVIPTKSRRFAGNLAGIEALDFFCPLNNSISGSCIRSKQCYLQPRAFACFTMGCLKRSVIEWLFCLFAWLACEGFSHLLQVCWCPTLHLKRVGKEHEAFFLFFPRVSAEASALAKPALHHMFKK